MNKFKFLGLGLVSVTLLLGACNDETTSKEEKEVKDDVVNELDKTDEKEVIDVELVEKEDEKGPEENTEKVEEVEEVEKVEDVDKNEVSKTLDTLPSVKQEVAKWNDIAKLTEDKRYFMHEDSVKKDTKKSNENVTVFSHSFNTSLGESIEYFVDNKTNKITELRLLGYERSDADRTSIYHIMTIFLTYIDGGKLGINEYGEFLAPTFAGAEEGVHSIDVNGKKYEFTVDFSDGLNMLKYKF